MIENSILNSQDLIHTYSEFVKSRLVKGMNLEENDPDTLKLPEEADPEWVNLWDDCKNKKELGTKQLTFDAIVL